MFLQDMHANTASLVGYVPAENFGESALIRAAQQGDTEAFEKLVNLHERFVMNTAFSVLRSREDAQDVYQEVFLRVFKNLGRFRFKCSFRTWVYRIATNACLDQLRRKAVRKEQVIRAGVEPGVLGWR